MEAGAKLDKRADLASDGDNTSSGGHDTGYQLENGGLA